VCKRKSVESKECLDQKERGIWRILHTYSFIVFSLPNMVMRSRTKWTWQSIYRI